MIYSPSCLVCCVLGKQDALAGWDSLPGFPLEGLSADDSRSSQALVSVALHLCETPEKLCISLSMTKNICNEVFWIYPYSSMYYKA